MLISRPLIPAPPSGTKAGPSTLLLWAFPATATALRQQRKRLPLHRASATPVHRPIAALRGVSLDPRPLAVLSGLTASVQLRYACLPAPAGSAPLKAGCYDGQPSAKSLRSSFVAWGLLTASGDASSWGTGHPSAHVPAMLAPLTVATRACTSRSGAIRCPQHTVKCITEGKEPPQLFRTIARNLSRRDDTRYPLKHFLFKYSYQRKNGAR